MKATIKLSGADLVTYNRIFQHPVSHALEWKAVRGLFGKIGHIQEQPNGKFKVTRNGRILVLPRESHSTSAGIVELMTVRHFIENSNHVPQRTNGRDAHWLLVIDHHEARIFRSEVNGGIPLEILPYHPEVYFRHAHNSKDFSRGQEKPNENSFFEPVARALKDAGQILVFGVGHGMSSEMEQFIAWLKIHHRELSMRIIGTHVVDEQHVTEGQLFAMGQDFYSAPEVPLV